MEQPKESVCPVLSGKKAQRECDPAKPSRKKAQGWPDALRLGPNAARRILHFNLKILWLPVTLLFGFLLADFAQRLTLPGKRHPEVVRVEVPYAQVVAGDDEHGRLVLQLSAGFTGSRIAIGQVDGPTILSVVDGQELSGSVQGFAILVTGALTGHKIVRLDFLSVKGHLGSNADYLCAACEALELPAIWRKA